MAELRGARFVADDDGLYVPEDHRSWDIACVALEDVKTATGFGGATTRSYLQALEAEGPTFLWRLLEGHS